MPISTCTCVGSVPSPTMPMSRFMDATASFTGVSLEMPKKVRSAETLSAKDAGMVGRRAKPPPKRYIAVTITLVVLTNSVK